MAQIEFTGYLNEKKWLPSGSVVFRMSEKQSRKNQETGEWETDGYTYFDVFVDRAGVSADDFVENSLLTVSGNFKTKKTEKDGKTFYNNVVNATSVVTFKKPEPNEWSTPAASSASAGWGAAPAQVETPF